MIAKREPAAPAGGFDPRIRPILTAAIVAVVPVYIALAVLIDRSAARPSGFAVAPLFLLAIAVFAGLSALLASFWLRGRIARRAGESVMACFRGFVLGMALAETSALTGLVYFALTRDWVVFLFLVGASLIAFAGHAKWR